MLIINLSQISTIARTKQIDSTRLSSKAPRKVLGRKRLLRKLVKRSKRTSRTSEPSKRKYKRKPGSTLISTKISTFAN